MKRIKEIQNFIEQFYPQIGKINEVRFLEHKNINSKNYLIFTKNSQFVLHEIIDSSKRKKIDSMCKIFSYCHKNHVKVPEPIKNKKNSFVYNKRYLTKHYDGIHFLGKKHEIKEIAKHLALLHKTLNNNTIPYDFCIFQKLYSILQEKEIDSILKIINKKQSITSFDKDFFKNSNYLKKISAELNEPKFFDNKKQLIHNDLHPQNVIFSKRKLSVILDFGGMKKGNILEDIGFTSYRFASNYSSNVPDIREKIQFFIKNYLDINEIYIDYKTLQFLFIKKMLSRLSLISKLHYFSKFYLWDFDFKNHIRYLKHAESNHVFNE